MPICDTCGNDYDKAFTVSWQDGRTATLDCIECAAAELGTGMRALWLPDSGARCGNR